MKKIYKIIKLFVLSVATTFLGITTISKIKSNMWSGWKDTTNIQEISIYDRNGNFRDYIVPSETTIVRYQTKGKNNIKIEKTLLTYMGLNKEITIYRFDDVSYTIEYKTTYINHA